MSTTESAEVKLSFGEQLKQAREALNLSLEDVAKEIRLRPSILQQLENNEFVQKNVPSTFVRGYVRSYAKFLRLPDSAWADVAFGESQKNDLGKNARATRSVNQYSGHNRWVGTLTVLVLLVVAGMTGLWWWQNYQQSNKERDNLVQNYVASQDSAATPTVSDSGNSVAIPLTTSNEASSVNAETSIPPVVQNDTTTDNAPLNAQSNTVPTSNSESDNSNVLPKGESFNTDNTANVETTAKVEEPALLPPPPAAQGDLVIEITKNSSWISVKDKNRKVLAQKEYKQGETLSFNGEDYAVIIGAPGNVRITYKGNDYPLKVDGRIAKFKLP
ncbi:DNA-binding helix-turn-helix protein [Haemophilus pittmaniae HK 85]|uniref:DNA-binding helix-turn-helix protein n=1 Tax=Haemophilus pittmaniae HK 85 TaxID=1035188 RepID=F9Q745_9PAST|nr:RodZ family helix-turn-helix domain-containing protein [Haemophilus pittmaniae]EGV07353.1 DNA-binding helix-turn-helix protein [Haemophilus pittmaniae HK 85]SNV89694.1 transcriptional regulator with an N-terminal xre-type HTH domain [Haemophilus pittmaniae]